MKRSRIAHETSSTEDITSRGHNREIRGGKIEMNREDNRERRSRKVDKMSWEHSEESRITDKTNSTPDSMTREHNRDRRGRKIDKVNMQHSNKTNKMAQKIDERGRDRKFDKMISKQCNKANKMAENIGKHERDRKFDKMISEHSDETSSTTQKTAQDRSADNRGETSGNDSTQQPVWNPAVPYVKWKVFVRGEDFTLQGRGVCEEDSDEDPLTPSHGEVASSFYESVVTPGDTRGHGSMNTHTHRYTERHTHNQSTQGHSSRDTHTHEHTGRHTHMQDTRKGDSGASLRGGQTDTHTEDTSTHTNTHTSLGPQHTNTALRLAQNGDTAGLSALLDDGLSVNTKDSYSWSLLMVAACAGNADTVRALLNRGARTGYRDARGNTALYLATMRGHREVTEMLIKANKPAKKRTNTQTATRGRETQEHSSTSNSDEDDEEYFCETCKVAVKERDRTTHKASIVHQFKTTTNVQTHFAIPPSNRGYQLLVGQGWDTEGGLGSEQQGLKFPVKTVLKRDRKGIGAGGEMPRVTHFGPGDAGAVRGLGNSGRVERIATISKREAQRRKKKEQQEEIRLRRMLNEPDF